MVEKPISTNFSASAIVRLNTIKDRVQFSPAMQLKCSYTGWNLNEYHSIILHKFQYFLKIIEFY
ncbi:hypothetical protein BLA27_03655 [Brucella cytisi]|uniref:Uncharacterized protein n=1 Tax=Brucella cytisi TaxID=407152 RepID=A0A1J6IIZ5_9HYPH|nr:hypothetical protein BLA27_03655 [Brucella cytisi]